MRCASISAAAERIGPASEASSGSDDPGGDGGSNDARVAIVVARPGGLVAAATNPKASEPVLFEQAQRPGGQWSGDPICSGVWPSMRTSTSRVLTSWRPADAPGLAVYPSQSRDRRLPAALCEPIDLSGDELRTKVHEVRPCLAAGPCAPMRATLEILTESWSPVAASALAHSRGAGAGVFPGSHGVAHTSACSIRGRYRGKRARRGLCHQCPRGRRRSRMLGAARVDLEPSSGGAMCCRSWWQACPPTIAVHALQALARSRCRAANSGEMPRGWCWPGAVVPNNSARRSRPTASSSSLTLSQHFLPLVAEGRIEVRPGSTG